MLAIAELDRLVRRPGHRAGEEFRVQGAQVQREPVEGKAGRPQPPSELGDQPGIVKLVASVARQPFDEVENGRLGARRIGRRRRPPIRLVGAGGAHWSKVVRCAPSSAMKMASRLAGSVVLAFSLTRCSLPGGSKKLSPAL